MDTDRLTKILNLTQSPNDAEALSAARMANAMIMRAGKTWGDLITSGYRRFPFHEHQNPKWERSEEVVEIRDVSIPGMLTRCIGGAKGKTWDFVSSLNDFWLDRGFLTLKQYQSLQKINERVSR